MNRLVLTTDDARAAHEGTLTEIRRPFDKANDDVPEFYRAEVGGKRNPAKAVFPDGSGKGWIAWWGRGPFTAEVTARLYPGEQGITPPLGQPGDLLWVAERWQSLAFGPACGAEFHYEADGYDPPNDWARRTVHGRIIGHCPGEYRPLEWQGWQSAETLPQWASRLTMRLTAVRAERTGDVWEWVYAVEKV